MRTILSLFLIMDFFMVSGQTKSFENQKIVIRFIDCIKNNKITELSERVSYPLRRECPIPEIKNKLEFQKRYKEVFDDSLTKMIVNSKPSNDWSEMGWHGIMFLNGEIWLDPDGRLSAVNYQSHFEFKEEEDLSNAEKRTLHESIREFKRPLYILETAKLKIRIDEVAEGKYRYAAWSRNSEMSEKPDIVINNGVYIPEGTGGNHSYEFKNGEYIYNCLIIVLGEDDSPPALLTVRKGEKEILSQDAQIIRK